jgi:hypothetical protein
MIDWPAEELAKHARILGGRRRRSAGWLAGAAATAIGKGKVQEPNAEAPAALALIGKFRRRSKEKGYPRVDFLFPSWPWLLVAR